MSGGEPAQKQKGEPTWKEKRSLYVDAGWLYL